MTTYADQLASCQAAITALEGGHQEAEAFGRRWRRPDLAALYAERARLTPLALREADGRRGPRFSYGSTGGSR